MYGLIHEALQGHVIATAGEEVWARVLQKAGAEGAVFHGMSQYPDELTYKLVFAASEALGVSAGALLRSFGHYWVRETAPRHYGPLLRFTGRDFAEFVSNLDRMHDRVATIYLNLRQPSFETERIDERTIRLHYRSLREGLAPFVIGLLEGVAERFRVRVEVEHAEAKDQGADHDVFVVRYDSP